MLGREYVPNPTQKNLGKGHCANASRFQRSSRGSKLTASGRLSTNRSLCLFRARAWHCILFNRAEYYFYNQPRTLLSSPPHPMWVRHPLTEIEDVLERSCNQPLPRRQHQRPARHDFLKIQGCSSPESGKSSAMSIYHAWHQVHIA